jgi:hypothetical protein
MSTYITDPKDIESIHSGEARIDGKLVLPVDDVTKAARRIYRELANNPELAVTGIGLSIKNVPGEWVRISLAKFRELVLDAFTLVKQQTGEGGRIRFEVLAEPPSFWLQTLLHSRWLDTEAQSYWPKIAQPPAKIIARP